VVQAGNGDGLVGGRFAVEREVGRGAMGRVYRAHDRVSGTTVALKIMVPEIGDPEELCRKAELMAKLEHPAVVKTVAAGILDDSRSCFVAMEWLDGEDLEARHKRQPLSLAQAIELGFIVAGALEAAHAAQVIHRDVKPSNIFLCRGQPTPLGTLDGFPKLVDFGVAVADDKRRTLFGDFVGTPAYMAPEQARGDALVDARCDLYALGATLFELVAGRPPHVGPSMLATLARLVTTPPPRLIELRRDVSPGLDALVARLLETDPVARPQSATEVVSGLRQVFEEATRFSIVDAGEAPLSSRLGSSASRLVTCIVAVRCGGAGARDRAVLDLCACGADAVPLGQDSLVAHLGARRTVGGEADTALELGQRLARSGARVGVASGRAWVSWLSQAGEVRPVGEVVDRASALARSAEPGHVLADATTTELGGGRYEFRLRSDGSAVVGDAVSVPRRERSGGAPFVGRDAELAQVLNALQRSRDGSAPVLVTVTGPPGIGKSRLRREVMARACARTGAPYVVFQRSEAYGRGHALGAAADVLRGVLGLPKAVTMKDALGAITNQLGPDTLGSSTARSWDRVARLLANEPFPEGLDPRGARDALWLEMTELVLEVAANEPLAVVLEDLQWADAESVEWVDHLLGRAAGRPVLVLALLRPDFWVEGRDRFSGRDHLRLELRLISSQAARVIARSLLGEDARDDVVERIVERAGGLPLFAEELARLAAAGRDATQAPTIEALIQVALDGLGDEGRDAVGRLSVLGLSCWDAALEALGIRGAETVMKSLAAAEILLEQSESRFVGCTEWTFKHALVREVAYQSLGGAERRELHALAADWLSSIGEDAATVAGHYELGGQHRRAADHWERAARRALAANALGEALRMAERSLAFAEGKPTRFQRACTLDEAWSRLDPRASDRETAIVALAENVHDEASDVRARGARARYDDARGTGEHINARLAEARNQARRLGLHDEEARCSATLAFRLAFAGQFVDAEAEALRLLELSSERNVFAAAVDAYQTQAIIRQTQGALMSALEARRNAAGAARSAGLKEREAMLTTNLGFALTTIGARQEARSALEAGLALADAIGSSGAVRNAHMNLLGWAATFGSDRSLDFQLGEVRATADAAASGTWVLPDRVNLGILFYRAAEYLRAKLPGADARARSLLTVVSQTYRSAGHRDVLPAALGLWAEAERRCGAVAQAIELAREAVELLERGEPSLLNESAVYMPLHDAYLDMEKAEAARETVARALPSLTRRLRGLAGTDYARSFLTELPHNASLLAAAQGYGLVPDEVRRILERGDDFG